jgi:hypothetical protein
VRRPVSRREPNPTIEISRPNANPVFAGARLPKGSGKPPGRVLWDSVMIGDGFLRFLVKELGQQKGVYRPLGARPSHDSAGKLVLQVTFAAPSPLLLFGGQ